MLFLLVFAACFGASCNSAKECLALADSYYDGGDVKTATNMAYKACELGDALGCAKAGFGARQSKDFAKAFRYYQKGCEGGVVDACVMVAVHYALGDGVLRNLQKAYKSAINPCQNSKKAAACSVVASYYFEQKDIINAQKYTQMACEYGEKKMCEAAKILEQNR